ncbi:MAG: arsenate reductase family protein [Flavobacteriaceae bacterium]
MKNTFLYLSTCSTCVRIIKALGIEQAPYLQDVKQQKATPEQLAFLYEHTQSYEALVNKRGRVFAQLKREGMVFTEAVYKGLLESEYSCLKRPILIWDNKVYLGNAKKTVAEMKTALDG